MTAEFSGAHGGPSPPLTHFWEHTIGSGHATLALRADWREQLRRAHDELGMRHVRFHGILCDDMGTVTCQREKLLYSFANADNVFDFLLSIGMRPFVELSFMPLALSSGGQIIFHYKANVTKPRDMGEWGELIRRLVAHWVDRHGVEEVRQWFFEVWNEPNLRDFWNGGQAGYFALYRQTALAIKGVDAALRVGGPATAANAWIPEFLAFCRDTHTPLDFITTHHYPTDSFGLPGDDTETELSRSVRGILGEQARAVRQQAGEMPVYYTEWCTSSNPRDPLHDDPYAAAFIVRTVLEAKGLVQGYSYWTFSDIFEENYFPSVPFHGGFGLLNIHGIAKPAYRAFELLHGIGTESLEIQGNHATVDAWLVRGEDHATLMLTNHALPRHPLQAETVRFTLSDAASVSGVTIRRIDADHACAKRLWEQMGKPEYPRPHEVEALNQASVSREEELPARRENGILTLEVTMPPQSVAAIRFQCRKTHEPLGHTLG